MTAQDILRHRLSNQQLTTTKFQRPSDIVSLFGAVQSQDYVSAKWALGQRVKNATDDSIEHAFIKGEILRTHVMRPTWHFVSPKDIRWMLHLTAPRISKVMSSYNKKLELDEKVFSKARTAIIKLLRGEKHLTRQELKTELTRIGIVTDVQRLAHIVMQTELDAVICSGPRRGKQFTYALLDERVPYVKKLERDEALATLIKRYFTSHGPATIKDFVWWSGLNVADARNGIEMLKSELLHETMEEKTYYFFDSNPSRISTEIYLLPNYDEYTIAYKDREAFYPQNNVQKLEPRSDVPFNHTIIMNGRIIGMWKRILKKNSVVIESQFFTKSSPMEHKAFAAAVDRYGKFFNTAVTLT